MLVYDEAGIRARLESLPHFHRSAFALGLAERWLPAFEAFSQSEGEGDADAIRNALERCWEVMAGSAAGPVDGGVVDEQLDVAEAHQGKGAEAAQAAAYCSSYAVDATNDPGNPNHAMYAARWAYNGIDARLGYELGAEIRDTATSPEARKTALAQLDARIKAHDRMQAELGIINDALAELASLASTKGDLLGCRERWAQSWPAVL
jgi:hypothetical protein